LRLGHEMPITSYSSQPTDKKHQFYVMNFRDFAVIWCIIKLPDDDCDSYPWSTSQPRLGVFLGSRISLGPAERLDASRRLPKMAYNTWCRRFDRRAVRTIRDRRNSSHRPIGRRGMSGSPDSPDGRSISFRLRRRVPAKQRGLECKTS
jgi:hypothetical protein